MNPDHINFVHINKNGVTTPVADTLSFCARMVLNRLHYAPKEWKDQFNVVGSCAFASVSAGIKAQDIDINVCVSKDPYDATLDSFHMIDCVAGMIYGVVNYHNQHLEELSIVDGYCDLEFISSKEERSTEWRGRRAVTKYRLMYKHHETGRADFIDVSISAFDKEYYQAHCREYNLAIGAMARLPTLNTLFARMREHLGKDLTYNMLGISSMRSTPTWNPALPITPTEAVALATVIEQSAISDFQRSKADADSPLRALQTNAYFHMLTYCMTRVSHVESTHAVVVARENGALTFGGK
jgi:hypothetical protein